MKVAHNKIWGTILALGNGDIIYRLTADPKNKSVCTGACAKVWPPVLLATGQKTKAARRQRPRYDHPGRGRSQVTYKGVPLYFFAGDH